MAIIDYLCERLGVGRGEYTSNEKKDSLELKDGVPELDSDNITDDENIDTSLLGDYVDFDNNEYNHFKTKSMIPPDSLSMSSVVWDWDDEHLEDYIVTIKKRKYGDEFVYEVIQTGDAELTNKDNPHQGGDRDVYSKPFKEYDFNRVFDFLKDLAIFE